MHSKHIGQLLGQNLICDKISSNFDIRSYLIHAPVGMGKHHLVKMITNKLGKNGNVRVLTLCSESNSLARNQDFVPFLTMLAAEENCLLINVANWGKSFTDFIPRVGPFLTKMLEQKKVFPAIFSNAEIEIILRIERIAALKGIILLCEEIDFWDDASLRFLSKLILYYRLEKIQQICFICTCNDERPPLALESFNEVFTLYPIKKNDLGLVLEKLLHNSKSLPEDIIVKISELSAGNIGIIMRLVDIINHDDVSLVENNQVYREITLQKLSSVLKGHRYDHVVNLLNRASLIGQSAYDQLLYIFTKYDPVTFSNCISDATENGVLTRKINTIDFTNHSIWCAFNAANYGNQTYHYELSKCIKEIMPSNYSYIAAELWRAGQNSEASIFYSLAAIHYYRTYRVIPQLSEEHISLMVKNNILGDYNRVLDLYREYFAISYDAIKTTTFRPSDARLAFEVDYVVSLAYINGSIKTSNLKIALVKLESWIEDDRFKKDSPVQWIRAAMLAIGVMYELHDEKLTLLFKKVEQVKRQLMIFDKGIQWLHYDFLSKCNFCYAVDTAYHYTKAAVEYFKDNINRSPSMYPLYISLLNSAANSLVTGQYVEAQTFLFEALDLAQNGCYLYGALDVLFSNLYVTSVLSNKIRKNSEFSEIISQMEQLLAEVMEDEINEILLRNNIAVMRCYMGEFHVALSEFSMLYEKLVNTTDVDDYYLYFIGNNYCILSYLLSGEFNNVLFSALCQLAPLSHDNEYFAARQKYILSEVNTRRRINLAAEGWNDFLGSFVGPAWSFWGKWLLFSDIQYWSD